MIVKKMGKCFRILSENEKERQAMLNFTIWAQENDIDVDFIEGNVISALKFFVAGRGQEAYLEAKEILEKLYSFIEK